MREKINAIKAEARVDQRGSEGRIRGMILMFAERPDRVRLDALTQFGPVAVLTADGGTFAFTDLRAKRYREGKTCPSNIARLLGVRLSAEQATALLLGEVLLIEDVEKTRGTIICNSDGNYAIALVAQDLRRQNVTLSISEGDLAKPPSRQHLRVLTSELYLPNGKLLWRVTYEDYRVVRKGTTRIEMPFSVRIEQPTSHSDTLLRFSQIEIQPTIPLDAFRQQPPPGISTESVTCDQ
jgi:hypothetical protein